MFLGFAGEGFKQDEQVAAEARAAGRRSATSRCGTTRIAVTDDGQKQMITAHDDGVRATASRSARCTRPSGSSASTRTSRRPRWPSGASIARGPVHRAAPASTSATQIGDAAGGRQPAGQLDLARVRRAGARHRHRAAARARASPSASVRDGTRGGAATTTLLLLAPAGCAAGRAARRSAAGHTRHRAAVAARARARRTRSSCMCGGCRPAGRHVRHDARARARRSSSRRSKELVDEGKDREEMLATFVEQARRPRHPGAAHRQGLQPLLWLVPYGARPGSAPRWRWPWPPCAGRASGREAPQRRPARDARPRRPRCEDSSTMSSATSTDPGPAPLAVLPRLAGCSAATAVVLRLAAQTLPEHSWC